MTRPAGPPVEYLRDPAHRADRLRAARPRRRARRDRRAGRSARRRAGLGGQRAPALRPHRAAGPARPPWATGSGPTAASTSSWPSRPTPSGSPGARSRCRPRCPGLLWLPVGPARRRDRHGRRPPRDRGRGRLRGCRQGPSPGRGARRRQPAPPGHAPPAAHRPGRRRMADATPRPAADHLAAAVDGARRPGLRLAGGAGRARCWPAAVGGGRRPVHRAQPVPPGVGDRAAAGGPSRRWPGWGTSPRRASSAGHDRYLLWWQRSGEDLARLRLNFDPTSVDVYDYLQMEWFQRGPRPARPRRRSAPTSTTPAPGSTSSPASVPVVIDGRFLGVAGADIVDGPPRAPADRDPAHLPGRGARGRRRAARARRQHARAGSAGSRLPSRPVPGDAGSPRSPRCRPAAGWRVGRQRRPGGVLSQDPRRLLT